MGSKKTSTSTSNSTTTAAPPSWTAGGLQDLSGATMDAFHQVQGIPAYTGDFVATRPEDDLNNILALYQQAGQTAGGLQGQMQTAMNGAQDVNVNFGTSLPTAAWEAPDPMDLTNAVNAAVYPVRHDLLTSILPSIKSSALESGAYTGDRAMSVVPGQAIASSDEAMQRIAAQLAYEDYQARTDRSLSAFNSLQDRLLAGYQADTQRQLGVEDVRTDRLGMLPGLAEAIMGMSTGQADLATMASNLGMANTQAGIDNSLAKYNYGMQQPFQGLDQATALLQALGGNYGTTTSSGTQKQVQKTSGAGQILGAVAGLGAMAAGIPGIGSIFGAVAPAAGAAMAAPTFAAPLASSIFGNKEFNNPLFMQ